MSINKSAANVFASISNLSTEKIVTIIQNQSKAHADYVSMWNADISEMFQVIEIYNLTKLLFE
ncbi:hypothetical protein [Bacillus cereus group sp. Bc253]|uniref:hypothetical protein n=1 Tax=Bacillus cereus group sp. Bc253 TaxID=3018103 RepID=UPI0022E4C100|nr:hypothetical protein [Bacillus cereus group sp. Bc253]MDA2157849.1 hypothetical protein [Bacillus cereus group sp. Bc253]